MMALLNWLQTGLLIAALIFFIQAARGANRAANLQALGLACWVLSILLGAFLG
jgi:hypothetical protein